MKRILQHLLNWSSSTALRTIWRKPALVGSLMVLALFGFGQWLQILPSLSLASVATSEVVQEKTTDEVLLAEKATKNLTPSTSVTTSSFAAIYQLKSTATNNITSALLAQNVPPTVTTVASANASVCGLNDGFIQINATGDADAPDLEYSINNGTTWQVFNMFSDLSPGTYDVIIRYQDGTCPVSYGEIELSASSQPVINDVAAVMPLNCDSSDGTITIDASAETSLEYSIDGGSNWQNSNLFTGLIADSYAVVIRAEGGNCEVAGSTIVLAAPEQPVINSLTPTNPGNCGLFNGQILVDASVATGTLQYRLNNFSWQSEANFFGLGAGIFDVFVRNADGSCITYGGEVVLSAPNTQSIDDIVVVQPSACLTTDGSISIMASGGTSPLEYSINAGASWQASGTFTNLAGGLYDIMLRTNDLACFTSGGVELLQGGSQPDFSQNIIQNPSNCDATDGQITVQASNDGGTFEYSIDDGTTWQTSAVFTGLSGGDYAVLIRSNDQICETNGGIATVLEPVAINIDNVAANNVTNCGANNGSISIFASSGTGNYQYSITGGATWEFNNTFQNLQAGFYDIVVRNTNGTCEVNQTQVEIEDVATPEITDMTATAPSTCETNDGSILLSAQGGQAPLEFTINGGASWQGSNIFNGLVAGTYVTGVRNSNFTCEVLSNTIVLASSDSPQITEISLNPPSSCEAEDGSIVIDATSNNTLEYSINGGFDWQAANTFNNLAAGTFSVQVRNNDGTCTVDAGFLALETPELPQIDNVDTTNPSDCGATDGTITLTASGGNGTYEYSINAGENWQASATFASLASGTYQVAVRNSDGSCEVLGQFINLSTAGEPIVQQIFTQQPTGCEGSDGIINIILTNANPNFQFSIDNGLTFQAESNFNGLTSGDYSVVVASATCELAVGITTLTGLAEPIITNESLINPSSCDANNGTITIEASGDTNIEYSIDGGLNWQGFGAFIGLDNGTYQVAIRYANGLCPVLGAELTLMTADEVQISDINNTNPSDCELQDGSILVMATGGTDEYEYSIDNGMTWQNTPLFENLGTGMYAIRVRNIDGSCPTDAQNAQLTNAAAPFIETVSITEPSECGIDDGTILITAEGGTGNLEYSIDGGNTWSAINIFNDLTAGNYAIHVRNSNGTCIVNGGIASLVAAGAPEFVDPFIQNPSDCGESNGLLTIMSTNDNGSFQFSINGGTNFQESNEFSNLPAGIYEIVIRVGSTTCETNGGEVELTDPLAPEISEINTTNPSCGESNGFISIVVLAGQGPFEYSIDGGITWQAGSDFSNLLAGDYNPIVRTLGNNCMTLGDVTSLVNDQIASINNVNSSDPTGCDGNNGSITINANQCAGLSLEYSIDAGLTWQASNSFSNLAGGNYTPAIRNQGSTTTIVGDLLTLNANTAPTITNVNNSQPTACNVNDGSITIIGTGGNGNVEYSIDGGTTWQASNEFTNLGIGTYSPAIRNADGTCEMMNMDVTLGMSLPMVSITPTPPSNCGGTDGQITINNPTGGNYQYSIDGGNSYELNPVFTNLSDGLYQVVVLDINTACEIELASNPVMLTSGSGISINNVDVNNIDCNGNLGSITITANGGGGNLEYSIDGGMSWVTTNTFDNLAAGNYMPAVRNADMTCETAGGSVTISANSAATITSATLNDPNNCAENGSIIVNASGTADLEYSIDNGVTWQASETFTGLAAGEYTILTRYADGSCQVAYGFNPITLEGTTAEIFDLEEITIEVDGFPTKACVPLPIEEAFALELALNGVEYNQNLSGCEELDVRYYTYAPLIGQGNDGPYLLDEWVCNNGTFSGQFTDIDDLVAQMNAWDATGNWQHNPTTLSLFGGEANGTYSDMLITHLGSTTQATLMVNETTLFLGTCVFVPGIGSHILEATQADGCSDVLIINVIEPINPPSSTPDFLTITTLINTNSETVCVSTDEIPGGEIFNTGYCGDPTNGIVPLAGQGCVFYVPNQDFLGQDEFCIVACDNEFPQNCDTLYVTVNVIPPSSIIDFEVPQDVPFDTCVTTTDITLPGTLTTGEVCDFDAAAISVNVVDHCVNFDPVDGFSGQTQVCAVFCDDSSPAVCDTVYFDINVLPLPVDCSSLFLEDTLMVLSTVDTTAICVAVNPLDLNNLYDILLNNIPYNGDIETCDVNTEPNGGAIEVTGFGTTQVVLVDAFGCMDTLIVILEEAAPVVDTIYLTTPYNTMIENICPPLDELEGTFVAPIGFCQIPTGQAPISNAEMSCINFTPAIDFIGNDTICLIVCDDLPLSDCIETTYVITITPPIDTISITAPSVMAFDTCLTANQIQLPGDLVSSTICSFDANLVNVTVVDSCLTIDLVDDFATGTTEICVVYCDDSTPQLCDTTFVFVDLGEPCVDVFTEETYMEISTSGSIDYCIPVPIGMVLDYTISLDGSQYAGPLAGCDIDSAYMYSYSLVPDMGMNGPYGVSWTVLGTEYTAEIDNIFELVDSMNVWDPVGDWMINPDIFMIFSENNANIYGNINFLQDATGLSALLQPNYVGIPFGTQVTIDGFGEHVLSITNDLTACTDTIVITILDESEIINIITEQNTVSEPICIDVDDTFDVMQLCDLPTNGLLSIENDTCLIFLPNFDFFGLDTASIKLCDNIGNCDTLMVFIEVTPICDDIVALDTVQLAVDNCMESVDFCLAIPLVEMANYTLSDNGNAYAGGFAGCDNDTTLCYTYFNTPGMLADGPYMLDNWSLNGTTFSGQFEDVAALVDSLNTWDAAANWLINTTTQTICGGTPSATYGNLDITQTATSATATIELNTTFTPNGSQLTFTSGLHEIIMTDNATMCTDTFHVHVDCPEDMEGCPELFAISPDFLQTADCMGLTEYCVSVPVDSLPNYSITLNGEIYANGATECSTNAMAAALFLPVGEHQLVFENAAEMCSDTFNVTVECLLFEDITLDTTIFLGQPETICLTELGIDTTGLISLVNDCPDNTEDNVDFVIDTDTWCITLNPSNIGLDTACLVACTDLDCINININVTVQEPCDDLFPMDIIGMGIINCIGVEADICLPLPQTDLADYGIDVNGQPYTGIIAPCNFDSIYSINYSSLNGGQLGPYQIEFTINGMDFIDTIDVIEEAEAWLNVWDTFGNWDNDPIGMNFIGGSSLNDYGVLVVTQLSTQSVAMLGVNATFVPLGTQLTLPFGTNTLVFTDPDTGCRDTLIATLDCVTPMDFEVGVIHTMQDSLCFSYEELPGELASIEIGCNEFAGEFAQVEILSDSCIIYTGLEVGTDSVCVILCDDLGVCDTNYVVINVVPNSELAPNAVNDTIATGQGQPVVIDVLSNDDFNGLIDTFWILTPPANGEAAFFPDGTINYVPDTDYCDGINPDTFQYIVCNFLTCDTATVYVTVECDSITIYNGFSPNNDGTNDFFLIEGITENDTAELTIFNRWGTRVYYSPDYANDWDGTWNVNNKFNFDLGKSDMKDLPDGTYFYVLELTDAEDGKTTPYNGWVQIRR